MYDWVSSFSGVLQRPAMRLGDGNIADQEVHEKTMLVQTI